MENNEIEDLEITVEEVKSLIGDNPENVVIVDVREDWELTSGTLPGAIHVPLSRFQEFIPDFTHNNSYIIYCAHGIRSLHVAEWLTANKGITAKSMRGGIVDWRGALARHEGGIH